LLGFGVFRPRVWSVIALAALASCSRGAKTGAVPAEAPRPLAAYAAQRVILTPTARAIAISPADTLGPESRPAEARAFDEELARRLRDRGLAANWILPAQLVRAHELNRTYAPDPYNLAIDPVRSPRFATGSKYGEPLSSQLRTMIAVHEQARYVLLPIVLRLNHAGRTTLRIALLDPRFGEARWVGEVSSDSAVAQPQTALTQVARRVADLFAAP
jgi:hypothetical protein